VELQANYPVAVLGPLHPYRGGIAHHTALLAATLAHDHPVLGLNYKRLYPGILFPGRTQFDASGEPLTTPGVEVVRAVDSMGPHTWASAAGRMRQFGTRLLVVQWWHPFFAPCSRALARAARRSGARVIYLCHNVLPHERGRLDVGLARFGLAGADGFIVMSRGDFDLLGVLFPHRPRELTAQPAFSFFERGRTTRAAARAALGVEGPVVLFFGLVRPYKGLDVLLRAVAAARREVPLTLLVAGEFYEERRRYDDLIASLGLQAAVRVLDKYIPNEEVETFFRAADVVVLPYISATQTAIAQIALSFERPVIVTRVGGLPEPVLEGQTGFVVPPSDSDALGRALVELFTGETLARLAPHLKRESGRFTWAAMAASVHRVAGQLGLPTP
jgi:glycosyltransferase involved in cell wall biosynthesis